jgi:hypothetical protein
MADTGEDSLTELVSALTTDLPFIEQAIGFINSYVMSVALTIGLLGNIGSFVIFIRTRNRTDACVQYLSCLALSDTGVIIARGVVAWIKFGLGYLSGGSVSINLLQYSPVSCKLVGFFQQLFMSISAWVIVSFSIERAYVVLYPLKRYYITAEKRNIFIGSLCTIMMLLSVHRLFLLDVTSSSPKLCFYLSIGSKAAGILYQFDVTMYNYAPCVFIFLANIIIVTTLVRSRNMDVGRATKHKQSEGKILVSLMLVSTLYVTLLLPYSTVATYLFNSSREERTAFLYNISSILIQFGMLNYCINFIFFLYLNYLFANK